LIQDYGFRLYNPAIAKFLSVDPLAPEYPELTPYQFASNTPIWAIDLDGLEAFFIHGTYSDETRWHRPSTAWWGTSYLMDMTNNVTADFGFSWREKIDNKNNNGITNNSNNRHKAALKLADYVMANRKAGEHITLIGHSHGGNVAIQAIEMIRSRLDEDENELMTRISLITVSTPVAEKGNSEDPYPGNTRGSLYSHIHLYNEKDVVQTTLAEFMDRNNGGERNYYTRKRSYDNKYTVNVKVEWDELKKGTDAHSFDVKYPLSLFYLMQKADTPEGREELGIDWKLRKSGEMKHVQNRSSTPKHKEPNQNGG